MRIPDDYSLPRPQLFDVLNIGNIQIGLNVSFRPIINWGRWPQRRFDRAPLYRWLKIGRIEFRWWLD